MSNSKSLFLMSKIYSKIISIILLGPLNMSLPTLLLLGEYNNNMGYLIAHTWPNLTPSSL